MGGINSIVQTTVMLFLLLDPLGNVPVFVGILRQYSTKDYFRIIIRECLLALGILLVFLFFGSNIMSMLHISTISLSIAGGIILFTTAQKMINPSDTPEVLERQKEPFFVPLAFPLFAGPSSITMVVLSAGVPSINIYELLVAVILAWIPSTIIIASSRLLEKILKDKLLDALQSLMGFLLMVVAVQMIINGLGLAFPGFLK